MRLQQIMVGRVYEGRSKPNGQLSRRRVERFCPNDHFIEWEHISGPLAPSACKTCKRSSFAAWAERDVTDDPEKDPKYWAQKGRFQKEYESLFKKLVPPSGMCGTLHGELLRCAGKVYHDWLNNGGCNLGLAHFKAVRGVVYHFAEELAPVAADLGVERRAWFDTLKEFCGKHPQFETLDLVMDVVIQFCAEKDK